MTWARERLERLVAPDEAVVAEAPEAHPLVGRLYGVGAEEAVEGLVRAAEEGELVAEEERVELGVRGPGRRHLLLGPRPLAGQIDRGLLGLALDGLEVDDWRGFAGALALGRGGEGGGRLGEVELGPAAADVARGGVVGVRGGFGGRVGPEPDADALDGVADLRGPLAPRPAPDAPVLRGLPAAAPLPLDGVGCAEHEGLALHLFLALHCLLGVEVAERRLEVVGLPPLALALPGTGSRPEVARLDVPSRRARNQLGEDRTATHLCFLGWLLLEASVGMTSRSCLVGEWGMRQ
jgi:hypothetical protein